MLPNGRIQKRKETSLRDVHAQKHTNDADYHRHKNAATKIKKARADDSENNNNIKAHWLSNSSAESKVLQESSSNNLISNTTRKENCQSKNLSRGSCNVLHHLILRSMTGTRKKIPIATRRSWKPCSNVEFFLDCRKVTHMEWDPLGVLLAVAFEDFVVRIYDWDTVRAAEMQGRTKRGQTGLVVVSPIIELPKRQAKIVSLKWNPNNHDELLIGTKLCQAIHIYDLGQVATWYRRGANGCVPVSRSIRFDCNLGHAGITFVDNGKHLIVSGDNDTLNCYSLINHGIERIWKLQWRRVTCILPLCDDMLLLGSSTGHLALLNWKETERAPFSLHPKPILLNEFLSYRGLGSPRSDHTSCHMGIRDLWTSGNVGSGEWRHSTGILQITWITNCGWMLSTELDVEKNKFAKPTVVSSTTPIKRMTFNGDEISIAREHSAWSVPDKPVVTYSLPDLTVWEQVPDTVEYLPVQDARVLLTRPRTVRLNVNPALRYKFEDDDFIGTLQLSKRRGSPICVAIHPSKEWIVLSTERGYMYFFNTRPKLR